MSLQEKNSCWNWIL